MQGISALPLIIFGVYAVAHFVGDFVLQTRWMAENKSHSNVALFFHVCVYSFVLFITTAISFGEDITVSGGPLLGISMTFERALTFVVVNGALHFATDYVTSRHNAWAFAKFGAGWVFWTGIGFDQLIHTICLLVTIWYLILKV